MENRTTTGMPGPPQTNHPIGDIGSQVAAEFGDLRQRVDDVTEQAAHFIRTRPGTSLLLAAAAGYLIGRLLRS